MPNHGHSRSDSIKQPPVLAGELPELIGDVLSKVVEGVLVCDQERRVLYANEAFFRITGYQVEEMIGHNCSLLQGEETDPATLQALRTAVRMGQPFEGEILNYRKDGTPFWNDLSISPIRDEQGQLLRFIGLQRDISERKQREKELEQLTKELISETRRLKESQAVAGVGSWETDFATMEVNWSEETFRIFESQPGSFTPTHAKFLSLVHPEDRQRVDEAFVRSIGQPGLFTIEHRLLLPDGRIKFVEERWQAFCDADGQPTHAVGTCQDITQRKIQEETARRSQDLLRIAGQIARLGGWSIDLPEFQPRWSDEVCRIHQVEPGHIPTAEEALAFFPPGYREQIAHHVKCCAEEGTPYSFESEFITAKGNKLWVKSSGEAVKDEEGRIVRMQGAFQDISLQKQAELAVARTNRALKMLSSCNEALIRAESEQDLLEQICRVAVEHGGYRMAWVGYAQKDEACSIQVKAHAGVEEGYLAELNLSWSEDKPSGRGPSGRAIRGDEVFVCPDLASDPSFAPWLEQALQSGYRSLINLPLQARGNHFGLLGLYSAEARVPTADEIKLLQELADDLAFGIGNLRAREETRRMEEAQLLAARRTELAARASKVGIWDWDLVNDTLVWDEQMFALYGADPNSSPANIELWEKHRHPEDIERMQSEIEEALRPNGRPLDTQFRITKQATGEVRFIRAQAVVFRDEENRPLRMLGTNWDVTDQVMREESLREKLENEKILRLQAMAGQKAKSEFLAVMSHEIRTPMNGVLGLAEMLALSPTLTPEDRELSQTIYSSGEALLRILDDILDFSRIEAGRLAIERQIFSPRQLVDDIQVFFTKQIQDKGLELVVLIEETLPDQVEGDPGRIRQILLNLVGNALKFTEHGSITIRVGPSSDASGVSQLEFVVEDTGPGIAADRTQAVFEAFTQEDSSISRRHGGTGLGLTISRRLAELMGGSLELSSERSKGTIFTLCIPVLSIQQAVVPAPASDLPQAGMDKDFASHYPLRILLVEDDNVNLKLMIFVLRKLGYQPWTAQNGMEAVASYTNVNPDCILMDLQMPEMDGVEATRAIREMETARRLPPTFISALTANTLSESRKRCLEQGMNACVHKPVKRLSITNLLLEAWKFRHARP